MSIHDKIKAYVAEQRANGYGSELPDSVVGLFRAIGGEIEELAGSRPAQPVAQQPVAELQSHPTEAAGEVDASEHPAG